MRAISQFLAKLFKSASRVSMRTGRGLMRHGTASLAVNAVRRVNFTVRGVKIAYEDLNEFDKAAVDEIVRFVNRFAHEYIDHHDEHTEYRIDADIDEVLWSHAREIKEVGERALYNTIRSAGYDLTVGRPQRVAMFQDEDILKQFILATIQEVSDHLMNNADK